MYEGRLVGVVVPAYNEEGLVGEVIRTMPVYVDRIYAVDDASTDDTSAEIEEAAEHLNRTRDTEKERYFRTVVPLRHETNRGVGGAIKTGYQQAVQDGVDVAAVMGGDGQMPPEHLSKILQPVVNGNAGYAKGNRLIDAGPDYEMPRFRYLGNNILSYLTKIASGYWGLSDPQNGFTAVSIDALERIDLDDLYEDYGYCNELLVRLNVANVRVAEVPHPPVYGDEESHIQYSTYIPTVSLLLLRSFCWRLWKLSAAELRPVTLSYATAGALFTGGIAALLRSSGSDRTNLSSIVATAALLASVLAGVLAMVLDRDGNRSLSTIVSESEEPTDDEEGDAQAPADARNRNTRTRQ
jgi:glycosyltransferase involved in cell wall biosynthesis